MEIFETYVKCLNDELKQSLKYYTSSEYKEFNKKIRAGNILSPTSKQHYDNILDIFNAGPTMSNTLTVYRGMKHKSVENNSFISTSVDKDVAKSFANSYGCCLYVITLTPGNYTILPLASISDFPTENEVLVPPGKLSIQKISPSTDNQDNIDIIYCTYIPEMTMTFSLEEITKNKNIIEKAKINLTYEAWLKRVLDIGIQDELYILDFDDKNIKDEITQLLSSLPFYDDIPSESLEKIIQFLMNCSNSIISQN